MIDNIIGHGGKGGGGHTPVEADDTLSSKQTAKILLLLGEGEIDSVQEVYLNRTPISNFKGASYQVRTGTSAQTPIPGFGEIESVSSGFSPATLNVATPYIRSFAYEVSAVRISLSLSSLRLIKDDGDIVGYQVDLDIQTRPTPGGIYSSYKTSTKKGKASGQYIWDVRVPRPSGVVAGQQWTVKVIRTSPDDADSKHSSVTSVVGVTELQHPTTPYNYPNSALLALTLDDAEQFGGRIPEVTIKLLGEKVYTPSNYNASTRVYTGVWNGAFKSVKEYTNNPAWILYHVLTQRMGMSQSDIDIGIFYSSAQYSDESVSDGEGGFEPRYTINNAFVEREGTFKFLTYILTIMNASFTNNALGQLSLLIDKPNTAITRLVTNTNVVNGQFSYSSNDIESRFSQVNVTYNEPTLLGDTQTTTFSDSNLITRYGLQTSDVVLAGCYSEAQAIRKARWAVWVNSYDTDMVSFSKMHEGASYRIGELVSILDRDNSGYDHQGVVLSSSYATSTITLNLDRAIVLGSGSWTVDYLDSTATTRSFAVNQTNGTFSALTFSSGTDYPAIAQSPFIIRNSTQLPITARVVSVQKDGANYAITCVRHNEAKYAYIDGTLTKTPRPAEYTNVSGLTISAPLNVAITEVFSSTGVVKKNYLHVTWDWVKGSQTFDPTYTIMYRRDNQNYVIENNLYQPHYDITDPTPGVYEVYVFATNPISLLKSVPSTTLVYNYRVSAAGSTLAAPVTVRVKGTNGLVFDAQDLNLEILHNTANDTKIDKLKDYVVEVWDSGGTTKKYTEALSHNPDLGAVFIFPYAKNYDVFAAIPARSFQVKVYCRDMVGDLSPPYIANVSNPVPATPSFNVISGVGVSYINITPPSTPDTSGYVVHRSTTPSFTPNTGNLVYKGSGNNVSLQGVGGTTYYYQVAAYDTFGDTGLNYSSEQNSTPLSGDTVSWTITDGLLFTQNSPSTNSLSWQAGTIVKNVSGVSTSYSISAGSTSWTSGLLYIYFSGSGTTLSVTSTLSTAVSGWIIGTYKGGLLFKGGAGEAYTDGSTIIAGTIGASQLVSGSAVITGTAQIGTGVITSANIADAAIGNAQIADTIQSADYSSGSAGWKIQKSGQMEMNNATFRGTLDVKSATSGQRMEITNSTIRIYDASGVLRVKIGNLV